MATSYTKPRIIRCISVRADASIEQKEDINYALAKSTSQLIFCLVFMLLAAPASAVNPLSADNKPLRYCTTNPHISTD